MTALLGVGRQHCGKGLICASASIDIPRRSIRLVVSDGDLQARREKMMASEHPWSPSQRNRVVSKALRAYASMATSADKGAVRILSQG